jgi:hypothetical protein
MRRTSGSTTFEQLAAPVENSKSVEDVHKVASLAGEKGHVLCILLGDALCVEKDVFHALKMCESYGFTLHCLVLPASAIGQKKRGGVINK